MLDDRQAPCPAGHPGLRVLHSGDIAAPDKLTSDPLTGRLTLNGFFTSGRNLVF
jgi:Family of unknown function (DUF6445)